MRIDMIQGRDFRRGDQAPQVDQQNQPVPGIGIVNEAFARVYFDGQNPVGRRVTLRPRNNVQTPMEIVGVVGDAVYANVREPMRPIVFVPLGNRGNGSLIVRTAGDPLAPASTLRQQLSTLPPHLPLQVGWMSGSSGGRCAVSACSPPYRCCSCRARWRASVCTAC
jgi:hypothetical protein